MKKFVQKIVPASIVKRVRQALLFQEDDPNHLLQVTPVFGGDKRVERIQGFRYPSPGSRPQAVIPGVDNLDEAYDTNFYHKDSRNIHDPIKVFINSGKQPLYIDPYQMKQGSKGEKHPAINAYDPTGIRHHQTTSWTAMENNLAKCAPTHLPYEATPDDEKYFKECARKGHPAPTGAPFRWKVPEGYNKLKW